MDYEESVQEAKDPLSKLVSIDIFFPTIPVKKCKVGFIGRVSHLRMEKDPPLRVVRFLITRKFFNDVHSVPGICPLSQNVGISFPSLAEITTRTSCNNIKCSMYISLPKEEEEIETEPKYEQTPQNPCICKVRHDQYPEMKKRGESRRASLRVCLLKGTAESEAMQEDFTYEKLKVFLPSEFYLLHGHLLPILHPRHPRSPNPLYVHPNESPHAILASPPLSDTKYHSWARAMRMSLLTENKVGFLDGIVLAPAMDHPIFPF
ncbi:hypothetical protein VNO77_44778 [Canavalia gladiata]|uniref:Retrotransposon Copia-like N-terminal domain-containing protein n=1 Tax=Canavalia gladiata TaxID=3824 RepID=A0AAN9K099_CANGL